MYYTIRRQNIFDKAADSKEPAAIYIPGCPDILTENKIFSFRSLQWRELLERRTLFLLIVGQ